MAAEGEGGQARQIDRASEPVVATRKQQPQGWKCMPFILASQQTRTFEKAASFGVAANLTTYLVKRFNIGQLEATNITNIFFATLNFTPLLGAFISDSYLGRFLNKGAIMLDGDINDDGSARNSWELCSIQQIEEVKCLIRIVPICFSGVLCFVALAQQFTFIILQAFTMDCHLGPHFEIPAGSIVSISLIALTVFIPIYDQIMVPLARKLTGLEGGITLLQRQGVGLVISPISMVVAGLVEHKRRNSALYNGGISPMTVLWLALQLVLMGIAEVFIAVGQIEFYNKQFPEHMQTLAGSLLFCAISCSKLLEYCAGKHHKKGYHQTCHTSWLTDNINNGKLDYYYYFIAILGVLNLFYFLICSHYNQYKAMSLHAEELVKRHAKEEAATEIEIDTGAPSK
ncbi:Protein NRT1/ PTR FAMILY 2.13 [Dichanthelium oligosanthes]|uniref:Protein NRT1/ PTR FAMILY 2.13 n=1 Tax=Dichanthelium oligosanthes TaxID=888268 RepID=A0A1E5UTV3_9POAL|nr:Protein NRT1/ PTR FAMILY 2.13 [Dichanthelium oligosanthes]